MQTVERGFWSYAVEMDNSTQYWEARPLDEHMTEYPVHITGPSREATENRALTLARILNGFSEPDELFLG